MEVMNGDIGDIIVNELNELLVPTQPQLFIALQLSPGCRLQGAVQLTAKAEADQSLFMRVCRTSFMSQALPATSPATFAGIYIHREWCMS